MNTILSAASTKIYRQAAKPILFRQKPDVVHQRLLKVGGKIQHITPIRHTLHAIWAYDNPKMLSQHLMGITFPNPVGLSAGFDKNIELPLLIKSIGFGFMEGGSITFCPCSGNYRPWFYRLPRSKSLVVHVGLANDGVSSVLRQLGQYPISIFRGFPLNISVAKTNSAEACSELAAIADYVGSLWEIRRSGLGDMITLNISCPNTYGGEPFTTPKKLERLLREVDCLALRQPVFVKMPNDLSWDAFNTLLQVTVRHHITGVTISNLTKDRHNSAILDPLPDVIEGGLSGKPTWEKSNMLIRRTYLEYGDRLVIIGVGGIFSAEDAYTKIRLGASLVELITGMIFEGPQLVGQINSGLVRLLRRDGFAHVRDAIGVDAQQA